MAVAAYKDMVVESGFKDILCTNAITGAWANKLRPSLVRAGLDPDKLQPRTAFDLSNAEEDIKAWRDLWSAGHGVGLAYLRAQLEGTTGRFELRGEGGELSDGQRAVEDDEVGLGGRADGVSGFLAQQGVIATDDIDRRKGALQVFGELGGGEFHKAGPTGRQGAPSDLLGRNLQR